MDADRRRWDPRYAQEERPRAASSFVLEWSRRLPAGRALDLACGAGGNLLALAEQGWHVTGIDVSPVALHIARSVAHRRGLGVALVAANLGDFPLPHERFDLVCVCYFLDRSLIDAITATLRPGGYLLYETYTTGQLQLAEGPRARAHLLEPGELCRLFRGLNIVDYEEGIFQEGRKPRALARLVARRDASGTA